MQRFIPAIIGIVLIVFILVSSVFTVDQKQDAIIFQFREAVRVIKEPGIYFKIPLLQEVRYFDQRIQTIDTDLPARIQTIEKMNVKADSFVKWQIVNVEKYYRAVGNDPRKGEERLRNTVNNMLRDEFGKKTVQDVITGKRDEVMAYVRKVANEDAHRIGVRVIDVRLKRVEFEDSTSTSVYERMQSERKAVASQLRAEGAAEAEKIRADADRQRDVLLADAYDNAQRVKGLGDAKASALYAGSYGKNAEFAAFYRSLDAYQNTFKSKQDLLVIDPNSEFFKYMKSSQVGAVLKK